jgi:hypothetical protein
VVVVEHLSRALVILAVLRTAMGVVVIVKRLLEPDVLFLLIRGVVT